MFARLESGREFFRTGQIWLYWGFARQRGGVGAVGTRVLGCSGARQEPLLASGPGTASHGRCVATAVPPSVSHVPLLALSGLSHL